MGRLIALALEVGLGALIVYWISDANSWNFWLVAVVVGGVYLALRVWGRGLFHAHSSVGGSGVGGSGHHLLEGMSHPAASFIVWLGVMMVGTYVTGVANIAAFAELYSQGWRFWLWSSFTLEFLMWVSLAFIAAGIASPSSGRKWPKYIFGPTFVVIFVITHMPWTTMAIRPRPETPITVTPGAPLPTGWEDTDAAVAERGAPVVVGEAVGKLLLGDGRTVDRALELPERAAGTTGRIVGGSVRALWRGLFPTRPTATTRTPPSSGAGTAGSPPVVRYVPAPPPANTVQQLPDCYTPCTMEIAEIRDLYTDGEPVFMLPPGWPESRAIRYSGRGHLVLKGGTIRTGEWEFWSATNPNRTDVLIRVFGK
jgi:hypothetical protein